MNILKRVQHIKYSSTDLGWSRVAMFVPRVYQD